MIPQKKNQGGPQTKTTQHGNSSTNFGPPLGKKQSGTPTMCPLKLRRNSSHCYARSPHSFAAEHNSARDQTPNPSNPKPRRCNLSHWKQKNFQIPTVAFFSRRNCAQNDTVSIPIKVQPCSKSDFVVRNCPQAFCGPILR